MELFALNEYKNSVISQQRPVRVIFTNKTMLSRFTGKEQDEETGLYYYGARYLDPKTSRWLSADPAMGEYVPAAPINDDARKRNQNLPGMGGVFNTVNLHVYHYAGNNPVKLVDPDGKSEEDKIKFFIAAYVGAKRNPTPNVFEKYLIEFMESIISTKIGELMLYESETITNVSNAIQGLIDIIGPVNDAINTGDEKQIQESITKAKSSLEKITVTVENIEKGLIKITDWAHEVKSPEGQRKIQEGFERVERFNKRLEELNDRLEEFNRKHSIE
jgi:RHS repeat-associated protein